MKTCTNCKQNFPLKEFAFKNISLNKRNSKCNVCRREKQKISYLAHRKNTLAKVKNYKRINSSWYDSMKTKLKCSLCGESDASCLDFHHIDSNEKDFNVGSMNGRCKSAILKEVAKCACLCSNCHRKFHAGKIFAKLEYIKIEMLE